MAVIFAYKMDRYGAFTPLSAGRCGQKIHKSKRDRQCKFGQKENVCLLCSYVFSVGTVQADRGINAPSYAPREHMCPHREIF